MKIVKTRLPPRIINRIGSNQYGIIPYDVDNDYPQRMTDLCNASGTATACVNLISKFFEGNGFADQVFYKSVINGKGETLDKLLRKVARDYARRNGFGIHINLNAMHQITDARFIPFHDCRKVNPENKEQQGKIAVYNDWGRRKKLNILKKDIQWFDKFTLDEQQIEAQVAAVKGWENYPGQVLWYSAADDEYPLAPYDSIIEDIETDGRIKSYKRKSAATGFNADYAMYYPGGFEGDVERQAFLRGIEEHQGDENAGNVLIVEYKDEPSKPSFQKLDKQSEKDFYSYNESSVQSNIRKIFHLPSVLLGEEQPGKLGMSEMILEATAVMNGITNQERRIFEETFQMIFSRFHIPINPSNNYSILPLSLVDPSFKTPQAANGG